MKKCTAILTALAIAGASAQECDTLKNGNPAYLGIVDVMTDPTNAGTRIQLHSLGAVKNGIMYASQEVADDAVIVFDTDWYSKQKTTGYLGKIDRPGSNFSGTFPMRLKGDTLIYTDSTDLIACNVKDPANPVQLWKKTFTSEVDNLLPVNADTLYLTRNAVLQSYPAFITLKLNGATEPTVVSSQKYLHVGTTCNTENRLLGFGTDNTVYSWDKPLSERQADGTYSLGYNPLSVATQGNYSYCTSGSKIYVYDHTNMSSFALKDSASGGGYSSLIYKNLLIVGGGQGSTLGIYDISKAPAIKEVAVMFMAHSQSPSCFAVDSSTNYLYALEYTADCFLDVINLTKYLSAPANTAPTITSATAVSATEKVLFSYTATATDAESTPTIAIDRTPSWMTATGSSVSGTPPIGAADTSFRVIASDGTLKDTAIVTVTVGDYSNTAPFITDSISDQRRPEIVVRSSSTGFAPIDLSTVFSDSETPNNLVYTVSNSDSSALTVLVSGSMLTFENWENTESATAVITVRATDPMGLWVEQAFNVYLEPFVGVVSRESVQARTVRIGSLSISLAAGEMVRGVTVLDLRGRELFSQRVHGSDVTVPALGAGVQILRIETSLGIRTMKIGRMD